MTRRQGLAKRFGGGLPLWTGVSECFTNGARPSRADVTEMLIYQHFSSLARAVHYKLRS
jgi:hypothetical protein